MVFLRLELTNGSSTGFQFEQASFVVEKKSSTHKRSVESSFQPVRINSVGTLSAEKGESSKMVLCFDEFHIRSGEWLVVYIHSKDREDLKFYITAKDLRQGQP